MHPTTKNQVQTNVHCLVDDGSPNSFFFNILQQQEAGSLRLIQFLVGQIQLSRTQEVPKTAR
jgi:hypothetical protein